MPRPPRATTCVLHHITSRGNNRRSIYEDAGDRERFYGILAGALADTTLLCHQDVLMGNHYHIVLEGPIEEVSALMWAVNHRYAVAYNARHERVDHLFGKRFHCSPIADLRGARAVAVYVALNPVRAGFVDHPSHWPYGSYRAEAGTEPRRAHLSSGYMDSIFGRGQTLADACMRALDGNAGARPPLGDLLPPRAEVTRRHVQEAIGIFGYTYDEIAGHYGVTTRSLRRWLAGW
jgi:putative transposase